MLSHAARERFGLDGKARATSIPAAGCKERATPPHSPKRSRPPGCVAFLPLLRCSSVTDRCGYAPSSRLGEAENRKQRDMAEYFNRLLRRFTRWRETSQTDLNLVSFPFDH